MVLSGAEAEVIHVTDPRRSSPRHPQHTGLIIDAHPQLRAHPVPDDIAVWLTEK